MGFDDRLKNPPTDSLRSVFPDNVCILYITVVVDTKLVDAYSLDIVIASSLGKEVHDPWSFYLHVVLLRQTLVHCGKFPTTTFYRSPGCVLVPLWLIIISN